MSPKELADLIYSSDAHKMDKIKVKPLDISQQKTLLKKANGKVPATAAETIPTAASKPKGKGGRPKKAATTGHGVAPTVGNPIDLIDQVFVLAQACGGMGSLKRLVERLEGWGGKG